MKRKTASTIAEIELVYRNRVPAAQRPRVTCSASAYRILLESWDQSKICLLEQFRILMLTGATGSWAPRSSPPGALPVR